MKPFTGVIVAAVLIGGGYEAWHLTRPKADTAPAPQAVPVTAADVKESDVPVYLRGIGTVRALNSVEIHPQVTGVLTQVPVAEGDEVKKDAVLAVIDPRPYQAALDKAKAQRVQDQAQLDNGKLDQKRYSTLATSDFASRQQVDTQNSSVARLIGVVAADDAAIEQATIELGYCVLRAPMDGKVGLRRVDPGNLVQANGTGLGILSVVQDRPITVVYTLPEDDLPKVKAAMAKGVVPVLADSSDQVQQLASGTLLTPDNAVDTSSGTISLKASFANDDGSLTPGEFVSVRTQIGIVHGVGVPHDAIQHGQDNLFVFTIKPDGTVDRRTVELSYDDGVTTVISKGVANGDKVITAGQTRVGPGIKVVAQPAQPAAAGQQSAQK